MYEVSYWDGTIPIGEQKEKNQIKEKQTKLEGATSLFVLQKHKKIMQKHKKDDKKY